MLLVEFKMQMARFPSFLALIFCLVAEGSSRRPTSGPGAILFIDVANSEVPNNTMIIPGNFSSSEVGKGLSCCSSSDANLIGQWFFPNGEVVPDNVFGAVFFTQQRISRVTLFEGGGDFTEDTEGVYTCRIPDDTGVEQILFAGIYQTETYENSDGPILSSVDFQLLSNLSSYPPSFSLTCTSTAFPPTTVTWYRAGEELDDDQQFNMTLFLRDASSTTYDSLLTVQGSLDGAYTCEVANDRGSRAVNVTVTAPSGPPTNITAGVAGSNGVMVSWVPQTADPVRGYLVFYRRNDSTEERYDDVEDPAATSYIIQNLDVEIEYFISVVAYVDLPSERSEPVTIRLDVPDPPTLESVSVVSATSIRVTWTQTSPSEDIEGYGIFYTPVTDCPAITGGSQEVEGEDAREYTLIGLEEFTTYNITVRARNFAGNSLPSNAMTRSTMEDKPSGPPLSVSATALGPQSINVRWDEPACNHLNSRTISAYIILHGAPPSELEETQVTATNSYNLTTTITFVNYSVQVAAANIEGDGPFSEPVIVPLVDEPGAVRSLTVEPDIVSVMVSWEPPELGRDYITKYNISWLSGDDVIGYDEVDGGTTSYRITRLEPETTYMVIVRAFTSAGAGMITSETAITNEIGQVENVAVESLNATAVQVSWTRLQSQDISYYRVHYTAVVFNRRKQLGRSALFPGDAGSGVVGGLETGVTYAFQVAAVVMVGGGEREGSVSEGVTAVVRDTDDGDDGDDDGGSDAAVGAIVGGVIAGIGAVTMLLLITLVIFILWRRSRSGKFEVTPSIEMKPRPTPLPLPDFDRPNVASSKPAIEDYPTDTIAVEGERVVFHPKVSGTPTPTIAWFHSGSMVVSDYSLNLKNDGQMTFVCVEPRHAGVYRFTVSNNVGSVQGQVNLFVQSDDDDNLDVPKVVSMRNDITDFGKYVAELHANLNHGFRDQYLSLDNGEKGQIVTVGTHPDNKTRNRFTNIIVYDSNRIKLKVVSGRDDCQHDYVNASFIDGYFIPKKFIATQGPVEKTLVDFWHMVWQVRSPSIVMITNVMEGSKAKCEQYWPDVGTREFGPFKVTITDQLVFADYTIRTLLLSLTTKSQNPMKVTQYHFTSWPDHGVPDYVSPMLSFHRRVKSEHKPAKGPLLVHCSAGVGRTGTYITTDMALQQAENEDIIDIPAIITKLRTQRMKMVQTVDQYVFIHDAVLEAITCGNTQIPAPSLQSTLETLAKWDYKKEQDGFDAQFHVLDQVTPNPDDASCPTAVQYPEKNRTTEHLPTDRWRVVLKAEHPDYINASFANGYKQKKAFILAQGPLSNTCRDFWKMVYERNCGAIVMLSGIVESGKEVCCRYWPVDGIVQYGEFAVSALEETMHEGFLERIFSVTDSKSGQAHRVSQFQVLAWGPDGKTDNPHVIVSVINCVMNTQRRSGNTPIVVHCSDSVSRSGVFCATVSSIEACKTEGVSDVFQIVKALRNQKPGSVPTVDQYRFVHELLVLYLESFATYSNFK